MIYSWDSDLNPVLSRATDSELMPLVEIMEKKFSHDLNKDENYEQYREHPTMYNDTIADEIRLFGGNTLANLVREEGPSYREIVCDVAKKLKVNFSSDASVAEIELAVCKLILAKTWSNMSDEDKTKLYEEIKPNISKEKFFVIGFQYLLKKLGFRSYQLLVIIANALAKEILGHGLTLATNAALTKGLSVFIGPVGWTVTTLLTIIDVCGPSYKVTIPAVVYIAMIRQRINAA